MKPRDTRLQRLLGMDLPIIQAPMAGADSVELAAEVAAAGGLGGLGCAMLGSEEIRRSWEILRGQPVVLNFFCHAEPAKNPESDARWRKRLAPYYAELGLDPDAAAAAGAARRPFTPELCALLEELRPKLVSFHFGLPDPSLVQRLKKAGMVVLGSATSVAEARWLETRGCDAIIAQGAEAGGHRGMFLERDVALQTGTMALVPQVVDAVQVPVIAAGGIGDARGIAAAFALGASAAQLGTAYLFCPEAKVAALHRRALHEGLPTAITNVFSGRPARGIANRLVREVGPLSELAPPFPLASAAIAPLRRKSEATGSPDFMQLWSGQAATLGRALPARELTRLLARDALTHGKMPLNRQIEIRRP